MSEAYEIDNMMSIDRFGHRGPRPAMHSRSSSSQVAWLRRLLHCGRRGAGPRRASDACPLGHPRCHRGRARDRRPDRAAAGDRPSGGPACRRSARARWAGGLRAESGATVGPSCCVQHRAGQEALRTISVAQKPWADALGAEIGEAKLRNATTLVNRIRQVVISHGLPGEAGKPKSSFDLWAYRPIECPAGPETT